MTINVNPDTLFNASVQFLDDRRWTDTVLGALMTELNGTAGMAGADTFIGEKFAKQYDQAAQQAAEGLAKLDIHLGQIASGLLGTAANYWRADSASNMQFPINTAAGAQQLDCDQAYAFKKEQVAKAQGAGVDTWDVIADTALAMVWPQGDTAKMRKASKAWYAVANMLSRLELQVSQDVAIVTGPNSGDTITAFANHCSGLVGSNSCLTKPVKGGAAIPNLQAYCRQIGTYCNTAADQIDEARSQVKGLLIAAGVVAVVGVLLTVFTLGGSDAAAGAIDAGIVAEAESIVIAAEVAISAEMSAAVIAEAESYLVGLSAVQVTAGSFVLAGALVIGSTVIAPGAANASPGTTPVTPGVPGIPGSWPPLTPAERAAFDAWKNGLVNWPETNQGPAYDYQRRLAGPNVYRTPTGIPGVNIDADGLRSSDGAFVDTKYTKDPTCTVYSLDNATNRPDFLYQKVLKGQDSEISRYTAAIANPANKGKFLEIDCNDPALVPYYEALMLKYHTPGHVVVIP